MEDLGRELAAELLAERSAVATVEQEVAALREVLEMERLGAGAELLEDDDVHPIRPELEGLGQRLPAELRAEQRIEEAGDEAREAMDAAVRDRVHHRDDRRLQRLAQDPHAQEKEEEDV